MDVTFENGGAQQKSLWDEAFHHLMNLPRDAIPVSMSVEFVDPGQVTDHGHSDLALSTWSYDSTSGSTKVRDDAITFGGQSKALQALAGKFGVEWSTERFYLETAVHELGHLLFASLPQENRVKIAQMFGAQSDSLTELQPAGVGWENQIIEGIAETFKEAFLPQRHRVFPNRTNKQIGYKDFSDFRELWRVATPAVPPIDIDFDNVFRVGLGSGGGLNPFEDPLTAEGLWSPIPYFTPGLQGIYTGGSGIGSDPEPAGPINPGDTLPVQFTIPASWFPDRTLYVPFFPGSYFPGGQRLGFLSLSMEVGDRSFIGSWLRQTPGDTDGNVLTPEVEEWVLTGDAVALGNDFPLTVDLSYTNTTDSPVGVLVRVSRLATDGPYNYLRGLEWVAEGSPISGDPVDPPTEWSNRFITAGASFPVDPDVGYTTSLQAELPVTPFHYHVPGESGEPFFPPDAQLTSGAGLGGGRASKRPVAGRILAA